MTLKLWSLPLKFYVSIIYKNYKRKKEEMYIKVCIKMENNKIQSSKIVNHYNKLAKLNQ